MAESADTSNAIIRPLIAWAVALIVALGADWLYLLPSVPASVPRFWIGGGLFGRRPGRGGSDQAAWVSPKRSIG